MYKKNVIGVIICVIVFALGLTFLHRNEFGEEKTQKVDENRNITSEKETEPKVEIPKTPPTTNTIAGVYKDFSPDLIEKENKAGNKVVLFFHAKWCPECIEADKAFKARATEIPSNVVILKTDYDTNIELKKKYGVTYQHTYVQVDEQGNLLAKWNGGDIEALKKYLK